MLAIASPSLEIWCVLEPGGCELLGELQSSLRRKRSHSFLLSFRFLFPRLKVE